MKRYIFILLFFIASSVLLYSDNQKYNFYWNFQLNKQFKIDKYTDQTISKDGRVIRSREIRDYVILVPTKKIGEKFLLEGKYYSYQRPLYSSLPFQLNEIYDLNFYMDKAGHYEVPQEYIMPTIRNIPFFPDKAISPGYMWQSEGIEIMEFNPPVTIPVDVNYQFAGIDTEKFNKPTAKIVYNYIMNHIANHQYQDIPYKFLGFSSSTLWYDLQNEIPLYTENIYDITFVYRDGTVIEYKGNLKGYYNRTSIITNKEKAKSDIIQKFHKKDKNLEVENSDEGVKIKFGDLYFKYNSSDLTDEAKNQLDSIGEVLKKYKDYNVIVKGYTDNIGSQKFNHTLSEDRAKSVIDYLIKNGYISEKQGSYKGYGEKNPIGDNRNEEGRKKNRRVEIIIIPE